MNKMVVQQAIAAGACLFCLSGHFTVVLLGTNPFARLLFFVGAPMLRLLLAACLSFLLLLFVCSAWLAAQSERLRAHWLWIVAGYLLTFGVAFGVSSAFGHRDFLMFEGGLILTFAAAAFSSEPYRQYTLRPSQLPGCFYGVAALRSAAVFGLWFNFVDPGSVPRSPLRRWPLYPWMWVVSFSLIFATAFFCVAFAVGAASRWQNRL